MERSQLVRIMLQMRGATPATIQAVTIPQLLKKHRDTGEPLPWETVEKSATVNVMLNIFYEHSVNRQRLREDKATDFKAEPRKWGERVIVDGRYTPLVYHNGEYYLECKVQRSLDYQYFANGVEIAPSELEGYLRKPSSRQGVETPVILRDYSIASLRTIAFHGNLHALTGEVGDENPR